MAISCNNHHWEPSKPIRRLLVRKVIVAIKSGCHPVGFRLVDWQKLDEITSIINEVDLQKIMEFCEILTNFANRRMCELFIELMNPFFTKMQQYWHQRFHYFSAFFNRKNCCCHTSRKGRSAETACRLSNFITHNIIDLPTRTIQNI